MWPECILYIIIYNVEEIQHSAVDKAVKLANILGGEGFNEMTQDDVNELINAHSDPLTDEDLAKLRKSASEEEEEQGDPSQEEENDEGFLLERLAAMAKAAKKTAGDG